MPSVATTIKSAFDGKTAYAFGVFLSFFFAYLNMADFGRREPSKATHGAAANLFYAISSFSFLVLSLASLFGFATARNSEKKDVAFLLILLNVFEGLSFYALKTHISPSVRDAMLPTPVELIRYMEWIHGPLNLMVIFSKITQSQRDISLPTLAWIVSITLGYMTMIFKPFVSVLLMVPAHFTTLYPVYAMWELFGDAIKSERPPMPVGALSFIQKLTAVMWNAYTLIYMLQVAKIISGETAEVLFCISSVFTKGLTTLVILANSVNYLSNKTKSQ